MAAQDADLSAILKAAKDDDVDEIHRLVTTNPSISRAGNVIGQTALHIAAIWGNIAACAVLIAAGANPNAQNQYGLTAFHGAVDRNHIEVARLLLESGTNPNLRSANGMRAVDAAKSDAMRVLCGGAALVAHRAMLDEDAAALEALLAKGDLDVSAQDSEGDTILHLAVTAVVDVPNAYAGELDSPEAAAGRETATAMLRLLLNNESAKGFDVAQGLPNDAGLIPLHIAAGLGDAPGDVTVCEALLRARAPADLVNVVTRRKDEYTNGQWGKKGADGKLERISVVGTTCLHAAVQARDE